MSNMGMGTPAGGMMMDNVEFDQLYIDMMIAHHGGIIALAQAALPRLTEPRLTEIAQNIIDAQSAEITELREYRQEFYGDPEPMPMGDQTAMDMMTQAMPAMGSTEEMLFQMDAQAQVNAFCASDNPDLTFIDMVIPHHEMAIASSQIALEKAGRQEIKDFAQRVIEDQQKEIEELNSIRTDLTS